MNGITLLCDQTSTDELGIRHTADQLGVEINLLPFHKTAFSFDDTGYQYKTHGKDYTHDLEKTEVIINRCQSKNRRLIASAILESIGKKTLNPQSIEYVCHSKIRTLLLLASNGIKVPRTVFSPMNPSEKTLGGETMDNSSAITNLLSTELGTSMVIKPDSGSQGKGVTLVNSRDELIKYVIESQPDIVNPVGVIGQEVIKKWFYDLRIIVYKTKKNHPTCHEYALARGGFNDFRTNTFLGNMVFRVRLPPQVQKVALNSAKAICGNQDSWVIGLDAMPNIPPEMRQDEKTLKDSFQALREPFAMVTRIKQMPDKKKRFEEYTDKITRAYEDYMNTEHYSYIESVVNNTLRKVSADICFHEGNACPDFWEQTRIVAGINLAEDIIHCAQSLIE